MADYKPPTEQLPIFDSSVFLSGDQTLTQNQADKRYLRYPNAQGTENLQAINVNGTADFNSTVNIDGILTTTNAINMIGGSNILNNISTRQLGLKDILSGASNGTAIYTNGGTLIIDSVNTPSASSIITFAVNNLTNTVYPLQLTPTVNNSLVSLDMVGTSATGNPWDNAFIRGRVYGFRDINSGILNSASIYYQGGGMNIECVTPSSAFTILNQNGSGGNVNSFVANATELKTFTPTIPSTTDASNKIPTTQWVQNVLSTYSPPQSIKRAWARRTNVASARTEFTILIPDCGSTSTTWGINQMVSFRLTFDQEWSPSGSGINQTFYSTTCILNLYPYRFILGWLKPSIYTPASQYTSGIISNNQIYASSSTPDYYFINAATPNSRQFWSYNIVNNVAGPIVTGLLNISGDVNSSLINQISIWVINPGGHNVSPTTQSYNLSLELLNPSSLTANITTPGGWDIGF
jgi:hypothetical protein